VSLIGPRTLGPARGARWDANVGFARLEDFRYAQIENVRVTPGNVRLEIDRRADFDHARRQN